MVLCLFADSLGIKSPTAARGRSVKEFEEQLTNLRKENFNLKLRIYFLEERMGPNYNLDKESAVKKNVELMVVIMGVVFCGGGGDGFCVACRLKLRV